MVSLLPVRLAQCLKCSTEHFPRKEHLRMERNALWPAGVALCLSGVCSFSRIPTLRSLFGVLPPGLLLRQHLLSNYVPGTVLSALYALSAVLLLIALEKSPIISFTVWTRELSQRDQQSKGPTSTNWWGWDSNPVGFLSAEATMWD